MFFLNLLFAYFYVMRRYNRKRNKNKHKNKHSIVGIIILWSSEGLYSGRLSSAWKHFVAYMYMSHEVGSFFFIVFQTVDTTQRHRRRGRSAMFGRRWYDDDDTCGGEQSPTKQTPENSGGRTERPPWQRQRRRRRRWRQNSGRGNGWRERASERETRKWVIRELSRGEERGDRHRRPEELTAIRTERMTARAREDQ